MSAIPSTFLPALIRKESRCLLQYISESSPWATAEKQETLHAILRIARHESNQTAQLIRYCVKNKIGNPALGAYPQSFMGINFASLDYLLPLLVDDQKKRIADLEWSLLAVPADAQGMVRDLIGAKQKHLAKLEGFLAPAPTPN